MGNDLAQQATSLDIVLYADDGKGVGRACNKQDCKRIQDDLDAIYTWSLVITATTELAKVHVSAFWTQQYASCVLSWRSSVDGSRSMY